MSRRRRPSGPDVGPRRLGDSLDTALGRLMPATVPAEAPTSSLSAVFSRWEEIAGPTVSRHVRPVRLAGEVLVVAVDQPAWATQVRTLASTLLSRVGEVTGTAPERLEVRVERSRGRPPSRSGSDGVG